MDPIAVNKWKADMAQDDAMNAEHDRIVARALAIRKKKRPAAPRPLPVKTAADYPALAKQAMPGMPLDVPDGGGGGGASPDMGATPEWLYPLLMGGAAGAGTGLGYGLPLGGITGAARGNIGEGLGRGAVRGLTTGAGAGLGGAAGMMAGQHFSDDPGVAALGGLVGTGLGGLAGWAGSGAVLGPPQQQREMEEMKRRLGMGKQMSAQEKIAQMAITALGDPQPSFSNAHAVPPTIANGGVDSFGQDAWNSLRGYMRSDTPDTSMAEVGISEKTAGDAWCDSFLSRCREEGLSQEQTADRIMKSAATDPAVNARWVDLYERLVGAV